jgi:hypothetical protein
MIKKTPNQVVNKSTKALKHLAELGLISLVESDDKIGVCSTPKGNMVFLKMRHEENKNRAKMD